MAHYCVNQSVMWDYQFHVSQHWCYDQAMTLLGEYLKVEEGAQRYKPEIKFYS